MPIRFKHGIEVDGSVTVDGQALGSNAFNSTTIPTHTSNLTNDSGFITQTAADLRYLQGVPQETGYNVQFLTSAIEMYDQATGGDLSWVVGADDRGGVGAAGQNAFVVRYGRGSRFNSNWRSQGTEAMTIDDSGRVGFTAPTPNTRFEIRDNGFTNNRLRIYNAGGSGSHDASIELVNNDDGAGHAGGTWLARSWGWGNASLQLGGTTTGQWSGRYNISTTQKTYFENSGGVGIRVVPETTLDVAGEITGRGGDTGLIFKSRNTSATGAPDQFKIEHSFGNVSISNPRGVINFTTGLQYGGASVATQSWVQGQGYLTSAPSITSDIISEPALISELGDTSFYNHFSGTRPTDAPSSSRGAGIQLIGGAFSAGIHIADGLYYRGANGSDISLGTWYKVASEDWVRAQGYLTSLPAHNHDGVYAPINHTHTFASLTSKPTTLAGYGITDAASSTHSHTNADVHAWLYKTGGNANDYTTLGIYRNYAEGGPIGGHNTILNIMQSDGRYGFQLGANTTADVDGLYYRSKDANIGDVWYQVASRDWVSGQGYLTSLPSHNHDGVYAPISHTHTFASLTAKPTTLVGYGITDAASSTHNHDGTYLKTSGNQTMSGILTLTSTSDAQLTLRSSDTWTGIGFDDGDANGTDYIWHRGSTQTFAIGGGGSTVAGKKLHIHGGTTIGSGVAGTTVPANSLLVEEDVIINGGRLKLYNANHGAWDDGLMIDAATGWAATIYRRSDAPKMFTGLRSGTDNYIWMSPLYDNTGTSVTAPRTDAVLEVKSDTQRLEVYLPTDFGGAITTSRADITNTWVGNAIYFGGGNNYLNWTNSRIYTNVGFQSTGTIYANGGNSGQWNQAVGWGNHANAGYITYASQTRPAAPTTVTATVVGETIEVAFNQSATAAVDYYQVWASTDTGSFSLIGQIPHTDFAATMTVVDAIFTIGGTRNYRVYAIRKGIYSTPAIASKAFTTPTLEPVNLNVVLFESAYFLQWDAPNSRFVDHYEVFVHSAPDQGGLNRDLATLAYSGTNTFFMYQAENRDFHQFWVEVR